MSRDESLDALKGLGCIMMVLSHFTQDWQVAGFLGGFAPALFFAVSGVVLTFQLQSKGILEIVFYYLMLFILGFSYNSIIEFTYYDNVNPISIFSKSEILHVISLSCIALALGVSKVTWLFPVPFAIHYSLDLPAIGFLVGPVFSIFPWLSLFMFGVFLWKLKAHQKVMIGVIAIISLLSVFQLTGVNLNKMVMSLDYFLLCLVVVTASSIAIGHWKSFRSNGLIQFFGQNSLLFLYVHFLIGSAVTTAFGVPHNLLIWLLIFAATYAMMKTLIRIPRANESWLFWALLLAATLVVPFLTTNSIPVYLVGIIFALNYRNISRMNLESLCRKLPCFST
ncbi:MAG: hypothetical protein ACP5PV_13590 [Methanothrix sp.]